MKKIFLSAVLMLLSMTDAERLNAIRNALKDLHDNLTVVNDFIAQVELLDFQRTQVRTLHYLNTIFK